MEQLATAFNYWVHKVLKWTVYAGIAAVAYMILHSIFANPGEWLDWLIASAVTTFLSGGVIYWRTWLSRVGYFAKGRQRRHM